MSNKKKILITGRPCFTSLTLLRGGDGLPHRVEDLFPFEKELKVEKQRGVPFLRLRRITERGVARDLNN